MTSKFTNAIRNANTAGLNYQLVDAKGQGKDQPTYTPHDDAGNVVVVVNARHVELTGRKWERKLYRWHTGYPGGLKERTAMQIHDKDPAEVLRRAVSGMLPKNVLRKSRDRKLRIFPDADHPFKDHPRLVNWQMPPRKLRVKEPLWKLEEGFEPMNPGAYLKRYSHQLDEKERLRIEAMVLRDEGS